MLIFAADIFATIAAAMAITLLRHYAIHAATPCYILLLRCLRHYASHHRHTTINTATIATSSPRSRHNATSRCRYIRHYYAADYFLSLIFTLIIDVSPPFFFR